MAVDIGFTHILGDRREEGDIPFKKELIEEMLEVTSKEIGGFKRFLIPEDALGREVMLDYRGRTEKEIISSIIDKVIIMLNSRNTLPLGVNNLAEYPNEHYKPTEDRIKDAVVNVLFDSGFHSPAETFLLLRSIDDLVANGELTDEHRLYHGFPNKDFMDNLIALYKKHGCDSVASLNKALREGKPFRDMILEFTALYDDLLDDAFSRLSKKGNVRAVIIGGKSSSGKTTTTMRLIDRIKNNLGLNIVSLSVDNYFRTNQPRDPHGDINYEFPESLDLRLIKEHLEMLRDGKTIEEPGYDFASRKQVLNSGKYLKLGKGDILVIDSHHGLFPSLREVFPDENRFIVYIEPLQRILDGKGIVDGEHIHKSRYNMLRRWLRDKRTRGNSFDYAIPHWKLVRIGELRDIVPRMKLADVVINSGFPFELNYLAAAYTGENALPDPKSFLAKGRLYGAIKCWEARKILSKFVPVPKECFNFDVLPDYSVFREFVGGSKYDAK